MIQRATYNDIQNALAQFPAVSILGSRQTGKTTLAKQLAQSLDAKSIYIDLELPSDEEKIRDAEAYLQQHSDKLIIIDEAQRKPELFPLLRALIDAGNRPGQFLLLGSAAPTLRNQSSESLAGRIITFELGPLTAAEMQTDPAGVRNLWLTGGYPRSTLAQTTSASLLWRESFLRTFIERDLPQFGVQSPASTLRRFLTMVAHSHGQLWNASQIGNSLDTSATTIQKYSDIFEDTFFIRTLPPYFTNIKKRLIKKPKKYIRDSGMLHALLHITTLEDLYSHPILGASWEGFVIEQVLAHKPSHLDAYFYRTSYGTEIDLLLVGPSSPPFAIEIKHSASPSLTKGFWSAYKDLGCIGGAVIYPGDERYAIDNGVDALPLQDIPAIISAL